MQTRAKERSMTGSSRQRSNHGRLSPPPCVVAASILVLAVAALSAPGSADASESHTQAIDTGTEAKIKEKAGWKSTDVDGTTALHGLAADTTGEVIAFASARASVEACGGGGGVHPLGGGGYELCGVVNPHGTTVEACQFEVGTEAHTYTHVFPCESASLSGKEEPVEVTAKLEGLAPATNYYYRLSVTNKNGTESAPEEQFRTESVPPSVISESVSSVTEGYATLQAQINPGGEATYYAEYGTSACEVNTCGTKTSGEGFLLGDTQEVQEEAKAKAELEARTAAATKEHQEEEAAAAAKKRQEEQASASKASIRIVKVKVGSSGITVTLEPSQLFVTFLSGRYLRVRARRLG